MAFLVIIVIQNLSKVPKKPFISTRMAAQSVCYINLNDQDRLFGPHLSVEFILFFIPSFLRGVSLVND